MLMQKLIMLYSVISFQIGFGIFLLSTRFQNTNGKSLNNYNENLIRHRRQIRNSTACAVIKFRCGSDECIDNSNLCNGIADCGDQSDESRALCSFINCEINTYRCNYGGCVNREARCNNIQDCWDGSDEEFCSVISTPALANILPLVTNGCPFPHNPPGGKYFVTSGSEYKPGDLLPQFTSVTLNCSSGYKLIPTPDTASYCLNPPNWFPLLPQECSKVCPPITIPKSTIVKCSLNGTLLSTCLDAVENTLAHISCEDLYEEPSLQTNPSRLCKGGFWDYPINPCTPKLINNVNPQLPTTCAVASSTIVNGKNACVGDIIFQDFFNNSVIDLNKWRVEHMIPTYSSSDYQFNSYQNIEETRFIKNNVLYLKPIALEEESDVRGLLNLTDGCTSKLDFECFYHHLSAFILPPVKSAKMKSLTKFKYGKIEIQAKLPAGDWIVPIIQLQPSDDNTDSSKIWISYSRGNNHLTQKLNDIGSRILYAGPVLEDFEPERYSYLVSRRSNDPYYNNFHLYTLEWLPSGMKFYFNSQKFGETSSTIFNSELQLSIGVSVGGLNDFPDGYNSDSGTKPWGNTERSYVWSFFKARNTWLSTWNADDTALKIDFVKITAI